MHVRVVGLGVHPRLRRPKAHRDGSMNPHLDWYPWQSACVLHVEARPFLSPGPTAPQGQGHDSQDI